MAYSRPVIGGNHLQLLRPYLLDPWSHGINIMQAVLTGFSELDITQAGSILVIAGLAGPAAHLIHSTWHEAYRWIRQFFLASVTIPGGDPLNRQIVQWILAHRPRHHRTFTGRSEVLRANDGSTDRAAALKRKTMQRPVQYSPHWGSRWFWHGGSFIMASREVAGYVAALAHNPAYDGVGGEDLTLSCFGRSAAPLRRLIETCREFADRQTQFFVIIYARDRYGMSWQPKYRKPIRRLETVHFDDAVKQELVVDIQQYLDPRTQRLYQSRSMPYRRGYLFYGPPGTGKTSLSTALAGEFGLDLYEMKIPSVASDADLEQMFQEIPPQCIVLLEDIDAVWVDRSAAAASSALDAKNGHGGTTNDRPAAAAACTLSGLLNVLDGVGSQEGRIVIMTTNKPELLDAALVRPGRVDMHVFLGNISQKSAGQMFVRMFAPELSVVSPLDIEQIQELALQFSKEIPEDTFTPSQLQGFFQLHLNSAADATSSIRGWVEKELAKTSNGDFEVVLNERKIVQ